QAVRLVELGGEVRVLGRAEAGGLGLVGAQQPAQLVALVERGRRGFAHASGLGGGGGEFRLAPVKLRRQPAPLPVGGQRAQAGQRRFGDVGRQRRQRADPHLRVVPRRHGVLPGRTGGRGGGREAVDP